MISFILSLILFGGFYEWNVTLTGICILVEILVFYGKKKPVYKRKKNYVLWIPGIVFLWLLILSFMALDKSEHFLGIMRAAVLLFWLYRCFLMEEKEKERIFTMIPYLGAAMVGLGMLSLAEKHMAAFFWQARRFGGFFQYPNTCALFLMIGLVLQVEKLVQKKDWENKTGISQEDRLSVWWQVGCGKILLEAAVVLVLLTGLFLTGCRSVLLLFFFWGIYRAVKIKNLRKPFFILAVMTLVVAYGYGVIKGDSQNIARIFTIFQANSTIYGRILYAIDAFSMVLKYPLGLGYMGYFYMQPVMQSGVYTTRFVHNDFLQLLVDYGVLAFLAVAVYLGYQLLKGKQRVLQKEVMILLLAASFMDFHMQYLNVLLLLVLCFDLGEKDVTVKRKELKENGIFIGVGIAALLYFTVAFGANYFGNYTLALKAFPSYTQAQINAMQQCSRKEEAVRLADEILSHNEYVSEAYHIKAYGAVMEEDFLQALEYIDKSLSLKRYDIESYKNYDYLFEEMIKICDNKKMLQEREILERKKAELPERLTMLKNETHPLAFRLRDQPQFMW